MEILDDLPRILFLLSFVLIGLFRWIANTIAERRGSDQQDGSDQRDETNGPWAPPESGSPLPPPTSRELPPGLPDTLKEFFETVTKAENSPPPIPSSPERRPQVSPTLTKAEQEALLAIKKAPQRAVSTRPNVKSSHPFAQLFSDPASLKRAFVMKEILDEPKALKSPGTLGSF